MIVAVAGSVGIDSAAATNFASVFAVQLFDFVQIAATPDRIAIGRFGFEEF